MDYGAYDTESRSENASHQSKKTAYEKDNSQASQPHVPATSYLGYLHVHYYV